MLWLLPAKCFSASACLLCCRHVCLSLEENYRFHIFQSNEEFKSLCSFFPMREELFVCVCTKGASWQLHMRWSKIKIHSWKTNHVLGNALCCALLPWNNFQAILYQTNSQQMGNSEPSNPFHSFLYFSNPRPVLTLIFFCRMWNLCLRNGYKIPWYEPTAELYVQSCQGP